MKIQLSRRNASRNGYTLITTMVLALSAAVHHDRHALPDL